MMLLSAWMKFTENPQMVGDFVGKLGYARSTLPGIALLELACVLLYAMPRTAVLGAVLLTGYLGGAIATHVRVGDPFVVPLLLGVFVWIGVYLRDDRLHALMPFRKTVPV
jgi:DoxX-like family